MKGKAKYSLSLCSAISAVPRLVAAVAEESKQI